jgi:glycine/D-amino acid oxidase-like deaminating enzyme
MSITPASDCAPAAAAIANTQTVTLDFIGFIMSHDITVAGAGVFGVWTAWHLRRAGASVRLVDAWGPGHSRASSGGETRIIRMGYGADEIYTRMAMRSLALWREFGHGLFQRTGVLWMAREDDPYSTATARTLAAAGVEFETVTDLARRWPQMHVTDSRVFGIFEPQSGALFARRAVAAVAADAIRMGVTYETAAVAADPLPAGRSVFACGPWLPKLFPELLGNRIFPTRQEVFFFAPPPGDARFGPGALPVWIDFTDPRGPYGFPDLESRGFKLAFDRHGSPIDPDTADRRPSPDLLAEGRRFLAERFPALADAPLAETRVCQYENTSNGDFLIDRHPERSDILLIGGGSGHGFKHGPVVGELAARLILENESPHPRFSLASKAAVQHRSVW